MRNAGTALPLALLLATACNSPSENTTPADTSTDDAASTSSVNTPTSGAQGGSSLAQEAETLGLKRQRQVFLIEHHIATARQLRDDLRLEEAAGEIQRALDMDPDNIEAKDLRADIGALLGEASGSNKTISAQLADEHELRVQQLKAEAEDHFRKGERAHIRGDYGKAIAELSLCLNHIRWAPYSLDWGGIDGRANELLERAKQDREAAEVAQRESANRAAHDQLRQKEMIEDQRNDRIVANMLTQAIDSFDKAQYDASMEYCDQLLRRDPRNEQASELRDAAFRAGREKVRRDYIDNKREEFAKWREHLQELTIPWTDVITYPNPDEWRKMTAMRKSRRGIDLSQKVTEAEITLRGQLDTTMVTLPGIEDEESLRTVVDYIRQFTGLPIVVDQAAENAVFDEGIVFRFNFENQLSVSQALNHITGMAGETVTWTLRHDAVLVTTTEKALGKPIIYNHDVRDLIKVMTNFSGPRIDRLRLLDELEDDDGGGPFGGIFESPRQIEIEDLSTIIQENVAVGTWDGEPGTAEAGEGFILIVHSPEVQSKVKEFLEDLRRFNSSLVTIESKFMTVGDNWLQEIGVDFRGLDSADVSDVTAGLEDMASRGLDNGGTGANGQGAAGPAAAGFFYDDGEDGDFRAATSNFFGSALGDALSTIGGMSFQLTFLNDLELSAVLRAVEKSSQYELVNSQILSVHNTQQAYVAVINQRAYIQDFDVEVAQFQAIADPVVNVLHEGVVLDVRPTIHHDRKYLTLEIQPTIAKVVALRSFSTTLGGITSPVEFQLPELEVQSVNTSALIPDGGSILLGGLSDIRNIERRAEVPWLARIPILGFLFKSEGYNDERTSLMILIRARITDVREEATQKLERRY
ncbi:MAG: tetratricopeptide (TPR) repeat protein [Planctomycetota bacterium]|jgi:tetratricopeptide (TPR) repeat protein